ncbi:hypothetical protein HAX54_052068 [Datura stramonium]|uniref:Uncharacterized protein n=1 Tax=Datura stramonium TaxID=4076 RepID=A0ABS8SZ05_DATST|nr:hypothetical protein [Datura stramonium]
MGEFKGKTKENIGPANCYRESQKGRSGWENSEFQRQMILNDEETEENIGPANCFRASRKGITGWENPLPETEERIQSQMIENKEEQRRMPALQIACVHSSQKGRMKSMGESRVERSLQIASPGPLSILAKNGRE